MLDYKISIYLFTISGPIIKCHCTMLCHSDYTFYDNIMFCILVILSCLIILVIYAVGSSKPSLVCNCDISTKRKTKEVIFSNGCSSSVTEVEYDVPGVCECSHKK